MIKIIFITVWSIVALCANEPSTIKVMKLTQKGERIAKVLCEKEKLPKAVGTIDTIIEEIKHSGACATVSTGKLKAIAYYLRHGNTHTHTAHIIVPAEAKCPVCGMFVSKYPKWSAMMEIEGKTLFFDGVKDMMKYYIFDGDFVYNRKHISKMLVSDYYTLEALPAKEAFYIVDADVYGPMGHELIAFKTQESAKTFKEEHHGKAIVTFEEISDTMVMALDGIVQ